MSTLLHVVENVEGCFQHIVALTLLANFTAMTWEGQIFCFLKAATLISFKGEFQIVL